MPFKLSPSQIAFNARGDGRFNQTFQQQIDFFRKKLNLPTQKWDDILGAAHNQSFVVAGAMKADLLDDLRQSVDKGIKEGKSIQWFRQEFKNIVKKNGWEGWTGSDSQEGWDWRTRIIYRTNIASSYAAGRWQQLNDPGLLKLRQYWKYIHNDTVATPRPLHVSWSGLVLHHTDPFWQTHFPPNGWGCRCRITSVRAKEYKGEKTPNNGIDEKTNTPKGIDKGWDYAPGATVKQRKQFIKDKKQSLPDPIAADFEKETKSPYWQADTEHAKWHDLAFSDAPFFIKSAIKRQDNDFGGLISSRSKKTSYYSSSTRKIFMVSSDEGEQNLGTWMHEYGHFLDYQLGKGGQSRSSESDFQKKIKTDTDILLNNSGAGRKSNKTTRLNEQRLARIERLEDDFILLDAKQQDEYLRKREEPAGLSVETINKFLKEETGLVLDATDYQLRVAKIMDSIVAKDVVSFMSALRGGSMVNIKTYQLGLVGKFSDLVGSATKNKILGQGVNGIGGHRTSYYKRSDAAGNEIFANLTALLSGRSEFWGRVTRQFYPELTNFFEEILND